MPGNPYCTSAALYGLYQAIPEVKAASHTARRGYKDIPVPLRSVSYNAKIFEHLAELEIVQEYSNRSDAPLDVVYFFKSAYW